jgi:hypothetical protein
LALFRDRRLDGLMKVVDVVRDEVRQIGVLGMVPTLLDGVQLGGIRRQRLEREPVGMVLLEVRRRRTVRAQAIPDHDHVSSIMTVQETQQPDELVRVDVLSHKVKVER